ncbi:MAG: ImmA/IrrE family metallo-endopeptidase [Solirubrobacterales bacterium]|nr:ImmA/IrrE family metallo-endopeptidase [Solirubrobacterales bacterium]
MSMEGTGARKITSLDPGDAAEIEQDVDEILGSIPDHVWNGRSLPVPVEEIAREVYGLRICVVSHDQMREVVADSLCDGTVSGLLLTGIGEIWINEDELQDPQWGAQRGRFTAGHELGHFVMHQKSRPAIYCRSSEAGESLDTEPTPRTVPEVEANTFSAALLLPAPLIRAELDVQGQSDEESISILMARFGASRKAVSRRVRTLREIT